MILALRVLLLYHFIDVAVDGTPNFLLFVIDDIFYTTDWSSLSPGINLNNEDLTFIDIPLPNIQRIMAEGITIPRSYAAGPKCSPSRYAILTGRQVPRSEWAITRTLQTTNGYVGTNVSIQTSKLTGGDTVFNIPYQLQNDLNNPYYTGMIGKWHLLTPNDNGHDFNCDSLNSFPDKTMYTSCTNIIKESGFDFVDGFYHANIQTNEYFGHNPEWMVDAAQRFITQSITMNKPFFLYFASTLLHDPAVYQSLFNFSTRSTPKGTLEADRAPDDVGMDLRTNIWQKAVDLGFTKGNRLDTAAAAIWMDDSLGAIITYLEQLNLYDDTFIVVINDHGMGAKGTLYEQGARIIQIIRYPALFSSNYVFGDDFIVSNIDLASIIFELAETQLDVGYVLDSQNWVHDAVEIMRDSNYKYECCIYRFMDVYNSHSIVQKEWKYIYRATKNIETEGNVASLYEYFYDEEQLYNLVTDPNEQYNQIHNESLQGIIYGFQTKMIDYIEQVACPIDQCKGPNVIISSDATSTKPTTSKKSETSVFSVTFIILCVNYSILIHI